MKLIKIDAVDELQRRIESLQTDPGVRIGVRGFALFNFTSEYHLSPREQAACDVLRKARDFNLYMLLASDAKALPRLCVETKARDGIHSMSFLYDKELVTSRAGLVQIPTWYHGKEAEVAFDGRISRRGTQYFRSLDPAFRGRLAARIE